MKTTDLSFEFENIQWDLKRLKEDLNNAREDTTVSDLEFNNILNEYKETEKIGFNLYNKLNQI